MKAWKRLLITVGIALEIVSISGFIYMTTIIPEIDLKAIMFYSAPVAGMLYGTFVFAITARLKEKVCGLCSLQNRFTDSSVQR